MRSEPVLWLGLEMVLRFRDPGELGFQEKHTQPTNKVVRKKRKFFSLVLTYKVMSERRVLSVLPNNA